MHLLYLTFGENISNHIQSQFSICSFLYQKQQNSTINVLTDQPAFYSNLASHVNIIEINEQLLKEWKGEYDFFWRVKIKAIEMMCHRYKNEPVVYLDSDTFIYHNINELKEKLEAGTASMHENEGRLSEAKGKTIQKMWKQVRDQYFGLYKINALHSMWNAGVAATPNKKDGKDLSDALEICDEMCKQGVTRRLIEQFALSVALHENYRLVAADPYIAHYWSNKQGWNEVINSIFTSAYFKQLTIDELTKQVGSFDYSTLPVKMRVKNTKVRLEKLLEKAFPDKDISFIPKRMNSKHEE